MDRLAVTFAAPRTVELRTESLPPPAAGEALVQTLVSAVSPGTEMLVYRGQAPRDMALDETIAALGGAFDFPLKYGYAAAGRVVEVGPGVDPGWLGRTVFAFNPHESHFVAAVDSLFPLPNGMDPETAVLLPNMETAVSLVMDGRPVIGEQVLVFGQGIVGLLTTALLARLPLASLVTLDSYALRRDWSGRLGAHLSLDPAAADALAEAGRALQGDRSYAGADLSYELSGNPRALDDAIRLTGYNGRVVVGSWYGAKRADLDLGGRFHRAHMQLVSTQVSHLAPRWLGRWTKARRLGVAWDMLRRHDPRRLITHRVPVTAAAEAYRLLDEDPAGVVQLVFTYE